jgi:hypothetical protein
VEQIAMETMALSNIGLAYWKCWVFQVRLQQGHLVLFVFGVITLWQFNITMKHHHFSGEFSN